MYRQRLFPTVAKLAAFLSMGLLVIFSLSSGAAGQGATPQRGYQPGGSYALSDIETINTANGNLMLNLPLGKLAPGRGGLSGQLNLHYDSKLYDSKSQYYEDWEHLQPGGQPHVVLRNMLVTSDEGGWHYGTGYSLQLIDRMSEYPGQPPPFPANENIYHWKVKVAFPDGSLHEFLPRGFGSHMQDGFYDIRADGWQTRWVSGAYTQDFPYLTNTLTYYSFDGTYVRLEIQHDSDGLWGNNPWTLYFPDGTKVTNYGNRITDRNGNYVEFSNITYNGYPATQLIDQLGRKIIIEWQAPGGGHKIHVPGVGGVDLTYHIHWKVIQVYKTYSTALDGAYGQYPDMLPLQFVVSEIDLPAESGGLKYVFGYNAADYGGTCCTPSYGWGEINSVTTPTGAQVQYQYQLDGQNGPGMEYMWDVVLKKRITRKSITYQQQYDGSSTPVTETWNYPDSGNNDNISSIVNPDGGIVTLFNDQQRNVRTQQPDGTVIEKLWQANVPQGFPVHNVYDEFGVNGYDPQRVNGYVKTEFTSIRDANGNLARTAIKDYSYDKNGNATSVREYDWVDYGSVPRGALGLPTGIPGSAVVRGVTTNTFARATPDASDSSSNHTDSYWNSTSPSLKTATASTEVSDGSVTWSRAEFFYDDPATTGNLTQQKSWDSTKGGYSNPLSGANSISVSHQYDGYGNPILTTDARGIPTQLIYGNVGGFTDLYPTQIKMAYQTSVQRTETREYDFSTGLVTRVTDVDNNVSSSTTYDVFGRPTLVKAAEGKAEETRTATEYSDVLRRVIVRSDLSNLGDGKLVNIQHFDQLGRIRLARQLEDAATQSATDETQGIKVQTRYLVSNPCQPDNTPACLSANAAALASYQLASNPYRAAYSTGAGSESTMGWTRSRSDRGGHVIEAQTFGGAGLPAPWGANTASSGAVTTAYDANFTTVTDQSGKVRRSMTDGLGRLVRVDEPDGNGNLGGTSAPAQPSNYSYDPLLNLITVLQGSQTRSFTYSSLGRLTSANNPESGMICYGALSSGQCLGNGYDANGNLTKKTDARNVVTDYAYDALNRNTSVIYSDSTPAVYRYYDGSVNGKGRLTWVDTSNVSATVVDIYDALGRPVQYRQRFSVNGAWGDHFFVTANYNKAGQIVTGSYPSGRTVNYSYDGAGRLGSFTGNLGDGTQRTYSSGISYSSFGSLTQEQFGMTTPIYNKRHYNVRGQLYDVRASTFSLAANEFDWNRGCLAFYYGGAAWGQSGTANNGNITTQQHWVPADDAYSNYWYTQNNYAYDSLNRLSSVGEWHGGPWGASSQDYAQAYIYDRYGNRTIDQVNTWGPGIPKPNFGVATNTNRLTAPGGYTMSYDQAGNLTNDTFTGEGTRTYDAENRMKQAWANNQWQTYTYDGDGKRIKRNVNSTETWQVYSLEGELLAEYAANTSPSAPQKEYGYRNGELLITAEGNLALNKPTSQTSEGWGGASSRAVDGNTDGNWVNNSVTHTYYENQPWWQVDLGATHSVSSVELWNRTDCCADRLTNFNVILLDANQAVVNTVNFAGQGGYPTTIAISGAARYVKVQLVGSNYLALAEVKVWGQVRWLVTDQLGTPRIVLDQTGSLANISRHDYLPFGEEVPAGFRNGIPGYATVDNVRQKFTGYEHDGETGLEFAQARYYASTQGRFTGVDSGPFTPADPQNFNRYAYVQNNPQKFIDPTGTTLTMMGEYADDLVRELELKTGYKLKRDAKTGLVTIDEGTSREKDGTSKHLAGLLKGIIGDEKIEVSLNVAENQESVKLDAGYDPKEFDFADYRTMNSADSKLGSIAIAHVLDEAYEYKKLQRQFSGKDPGFDLDDLAHIRAKYFEGRVLSDLTGSREGPRIDNKSSANLLHFEYKTIGYDIAWKSLNSQSPRRDSVGHITVRDYKGSKLKK